MNAPEAGNLEAARHRANAFKLRMRPEIGAGGFARDDSTIDFYTRVNALLDPHMTVLDIGAGRGVGLHAADSYTRRLRQLQGKVRTVIGLDVDPAIKDHPALDERHVIEIGQPYPLADASVDLAVADWVIEHIADQQQFASEIRRVLKPGGWFCARTLNRWSYGGIASSLVPNRLHEKILARVQPERRQIDAFPTVYRMNTMKALRRAFPAESWDNFSYPHNPMPKYHGNNRFTFGLIEFYQGVVPSGLKTDLMVFLQRC